MSTRELSGVIAIAIVAVASPLFSTSNAFAGAFSGSVPKAICGPGDRTESGLQGETTISERESGDSERGYNCNLNLVGQYLGEGTKSQGALAWFDHCGYYATVNNPLRQHPGTVVIDASDPTDPQVTAYLDDPVMLDPHESLKQNDRRKLLAGGQNMGPGFVVYDLSADCGHPVLTSSVQLPGSSGHMGGWAPDGMTYYLSQNPITGPGPMYIVDVSDPANVKALPTWDFLGDGKPHDANISADGKRLYSGEFNFFPNNNGLAILDVSDYQSRLPDPQIRIVSTLFWNSYAGGAEQMLPFSANGRQYVVSADELGGWAGPGGLAGACARGASAFGFPQIIDITDERNPKIIARVMLEVSAPENCTVFLNYPQTWAAAPTRAADGYNAERCNVDRANNPTMLACAFQQAGLRVFDIRDLYHPKEIAYYKPPALRTAVLPGSFTWFPGADRTADRIAGKPRFYKRPTGQDKSKHNGNGNGNGNRRPELEIWTVSDGNGFQVLRFTDHFKAQHKDLLEYAGE